MKLSNCSLIIKSFLFLMTTFFIHVFVSGQTSYETNKSGVEDRCFWLEQMDKLARPVLSNLAENTLKKNMPVKLSIRTDNAPMRLRVAYLEVFGRTLSGIAPWLNLEGGTKEEVELRNKYRQWTLKAIENAVNPNAKDYVEWYKEWDGQPLCDASYLALAILRCPWLWNHLNENVKGQLVESFKLATKAHGPKNNWLLFPCMIDAFFCKYGFEWNNERVNNCLNQLEKWYVGDGLYSDGAKYRFDYYNSYVIHPYLTQMLEVFSEKDDSLKVTYTRLKRRNERYSIIQERLINTDGTYPATGRSIVYRGAAFHHLADMSMRKELPKQLKPAQVRCALTAVIRKTMLAKGTYNKEGWLNIGIAGSQPDLADIYNNTGSLYICSNIFLPLGLSETDEFWSSPPMDWTARKLWNGEDVAGDHALD